ncbi:hypothetical protein ABW19_dt0209342 [Dactylella cylindrospora]|nr:hypothetical protein ABW19_dt0209342 [Dactylella cylindrospora]
MPGGYCRPELYFQEDDFLPTIKGDWGCHMDHQIINPEAEDAERYRLRAEKYQFLFPALRLARNIAQHVDNLTQGSQDDSSQNIEATRRRDSMMAALSLAPLPCIWIYSERNMDFNNWGFTTSEIDTETGGERYTIMAPRAIIWILQSKHTSYHRKMVASFLLANMIVREMGYIVEQQKAGAFKNVSMRGHRIFSNAPMRIAYGQELMTKLYGGPLQPILDGASIYSLRSVAVGPHGWNSRYMEFDPTYINRLFSPGYWKAKGIVRLRPPMQPCVRVTTLTQPADSQAGFIGMARRPDTIRKADRSAST